MSTLSVIKGDVSEIDAVRLVAALSGSNDVHVESTQYFPYFSFAGACTLPSLFGSRQVHVRCLIDAVTGHGATADPFEIDYEERQDSNTISVEISVQAASVSAQRTLTHTLGRNLRVIARFDPVFDVATLVHKKFWVVGDGHVRAMVDSADGSMHPLRVNAA